MTPNEIADNRADLLTFTQTMFRARKGADMMPASHHKPICDALERVVIGKTKRLIINIPPRSGKTEIAVINFMAWCMGNWPDSEFIHASYSKRLATANTYAVRATMTHEVYREIFDHTALADDSKAKDEFRTEHGGIVYATGAEGSITGYGAGKMRATFGGAIVIDDPHKAGEANSAIMRQNVIDWFSTTMESRKNSPDTPIIVIMQRLHENDLTGWLLGGGNGEHWDHLCIPAVNEQGESFWPEQFPLDMLERLKASNSYVYAGQYMQRPSPDGGGLLKTSWFRYYDQLPPIKYRVVFADTAQKTGDMNDYSVFQCWGYPGDGTAYLLDQVRGKWEAPELLATARAFWNKQKAAGGVGVMRAFKIEDKVSGTGLIQTLKRERIPVQGIKRDRDKVTRAIDAGPTVEAGCVYLPQSAPWLSGLLSEIESFPAGAHDDQVDPLMDAVSELMQPAPVIGML